MGRRSGAARRKSKGDSPAPASPSAKEAPTAKVEIVAKYNDSELAAQWDILCSDLVNVLGQLEKLKTDPRMSAARREKFELSHQHLESASIQALLAYGDRSIG